MIPESVFTATAYTSFGLPSSHWQANSSPTSGIQNSLGTWCPRTQLSIVKSMPTITLTRPGSCHYAITMTAHWRDEIWWNIGGLLSKLPIRQNKFTARISGYTVYCISFYLLKCSVDTSCIAAMSLIACLLSAHSPSWSPPPACMLHVL